MPVDYASEAVDFDALFDPVNPLSPGVTPPATGYAVAGVDLAGRYAPLSFGTKRPDIGYATAGLDLSNLWAAFGTATYVSPNAGLPAIVDAVVNSPSGPVSAGVSFTLNRNGTTFWDGGGAGAWYPGAGSTIGDAYDVRFTLVSSQFAGTLSGGPLATWLQLNSARGMSLGVTSSTTAGARARRVIRVEIRRRSDLVIEATWDIELYVAVEIN